jgi:hypothetical protein
MVSVKEKEANEGKDIEVDGKIKRFRKRLTAQKPGIENYKKLGCISATRVTESDILKGQ